MIDNLEGKNKNEGNKEIQSQCRKWMYAIVAASFAYLAALPDSNEHTKEINSIKSEIDKQNDALNKQNNKLDNIIKNIELFSYENLIINNENTSNSCSGIEINNNIKPKNQFEKKIIA